MDPRASLPLGRVDAARTQQLTPLTPEERAATRCSPPLLAGQTRSTPNEALQDAANEERAGWSQQGTSYGAVLTLFAVALYLFGLSVTLKHGRKELFAVLGAALRHRSSVGAHYIADATRTSLDEAAMLSRRARSPPASRSTAGYQEAERHFTRAIELRPSFSWAYAERSRAIFNAGSPQTGQSFVSISSPEAASRSTEDLRKAISLGYENSGVWSNLGFHLFIEAVQTGEEDLLDESIPALERGHRAERSGDLLPLQPRPVPPGRRRHRGGQRGLPGCDRAHPVPRHRAENPADEQHPPGPTGVRRDHGPRDPPSLHRPCHDRGDRLA